MKIEVDEQLIQDCASVVRREGKATPSLLQRRLIIGYSRAAAAMDELEKRGIVGPRKDDLSRDVLIKPAAELDRQGGKG